MDTVVVHEGSSLESVLLHRATDMRKPSPAVAPTLAKLPAVNKGFNLATPSTEKSCTYKYFDVGRYKSLNPRP